MKWYVKLELVLEIEADDWASAEYIVEDVRDELVAGNKIPEYVKIKETCIDALDFEDWIDEDDEE